MLLVRRARAKEDVLRAAAQLVLDVEKDRPLDKSLGRLTKAIKKLRKVP